MTEDKEEQRRPRFECEKCGGKLKKIARAKYLGRGCLLALIGAIIVLTCVNIPNIVKQPSFFTTAILFVSGIVIFMWGLLVGIKKEYLWKCKSCKATFDREVKWWYIGG